MAEDIKVRDKRLQVVLNDSELEYLKKAAKALGVSASNYVRSCALNYKLVPLETLEDVRILAKINGDLGRLGGLLKMWLSNDERLKFSSERELRELLAKINANSKDMEEVMRLMLGKLLK